MTKPPQSMQPAQPPDAPSSEETPGALIATASRDLSTLVRSEIELAKAEIKADVKNGVTGGAMFGAAGFFGVLAVILLSVAAAYGLVALGLHPGLAFLAVAGFYLLLAVVLALVGKKAISKVGPPQRNPDQQGDRELPQEAAVDRCADTDRLTIGPTPRWPGSRVRGSTRWSPPTAPGSTWRSR